MGMKEAYQERMEAQLKEWEGEMERLGAKAEKGNAEAKIAYYKELERFRNKQEAAEEKLDELREAGDETWEQTKAGIEKAWQDLRHTLDIAVSKLDR